MLKQGQISIFVIVSVVIVFVAGFLFFNDNYNIFYSPENQLAQELQEHVEACITSNAQLGVFLLGFQGGYIDIPQEIQMDPERRLVFGSNGSFSSGPLSIPNWDSELGEVPTIDFMESELETFIADNVESCIESNFDAYSSYLNLNYSFDNYGNQVTINDQNVEIRTDFPVDFSEKSGEIDSNINSYYVNLDDTPLGDLHSLAIEIYNLEEQTLLFEELVMDQIYSSSDDSSDLQSMPTEGITFSCNPHIWFKEDLKQTLSELNNNNFKYLYFEGTRSIENRFSANLGGDLEGLQAYYRSNYQHQLPSTKPSYEDYEVNVAMPSSEYTGSTGYFNSYPYRTFEVTPSNGEIVKAMDMKVDIGAELPIPCVQIFHHLYTLDYDLLLQLKDFSDDEQGLLFQFPLRVEIEQNSPKDAPQTSITTQEPTTATNENFCQEENRNTQATIYVQDDVSKDYLTDANVTYKCISLSCDLGNTQRPTYGFAELVRPDAIPVLNTSIGYCQGGELEVQKEGYFQIDQDMRIETGNAQAIQPVTALMVPTKEFDVVATTLTATSYQTCNSDKRNEGQFFISVENQQYDFKSQAFYPRTTPGYLDKITLLEKPGTPYNVTIVYMKGSEPHGLLQYENKILDYSVGNRLSIDIPVSNVPLGDGNFMEYFEDVKAVLANEYTCSGINFGMRIE